MRKEILFLTLATSLFFCGCSTKRQYFEPNENSVKGDMAYSGNLPDDIDYVCPDGATLENGMFITKDGIVNKIKLQKGEHLINSFENGYIVASNSKKIKILDKSLKPIYEKEFPSMVLAASLSGSDLALLTSDNSAYLIDISNDTQKAYEQFDLSLAVDSRIIEPKFLDSVVVYSTLDGKVVIIDRQSGNFLKDFMVSYQPFFNNIIDLEVVGKNMYAVSATKIKLIAPDSMKDYRAEIREAKFKNNKIYLFLKDGRIQILDANLNLIKEKKFKFAMYTRAFFDNNNIYIVEKTGYIIKTDLNLENEKVYNFDEIEDKVFVANNTLYHGDKFIKF